MHYRRPEICVTLALAISIATPAFSQNPLTLWYKHPANLWVEALPVGNGFQGGMIFGRVAHERIQFNESTVWTGEPHDYAHAGASKYLPQIRQLLFDGKQKEAEDLAMREFMSEPLHQKAYQAFGDLLLDFPGVQDSEITGYRRDLNLDTAVSSVEYTFRGVTYRREVFASYPARIIAVRLTANRPGGIGFEAAFHSAHSGADIRIAPSGEIVMKGAVADSAIRFEARLQVEAQGGTRAAQPDGRIAIKNADSATLILVGSTNFRNYKEVTADPAQRNIAVLAAVRNKPYDTLRSEHIADYQRLFRRVSLNLGTSPAATLPTDDRIRAFAQGNDPALVSLLFQYGRYLLIGSSRPGGQPANFRACGTNRTHLPGTASTPTISTPR